MKNKNYLGRNKKAVSGIIVAVLIIIIILSLIVILWNLIKGLIGKEADIIDIKTELIPIQVDIIGITKNIGTSGGIEGANITIKGDRNNPILTNVTMTITTHATPIDVFSVVDVSGSMAICNGQNQLCCLGYINRCKAETSCIACGGTWENRLQNAKDANRDFIRSIIEAENNRVGLIAYNDSVIDNYFHSLSANSESLINELNTWQAEGNTCICCGIGIGTENYVHGAAHEFEDNEKQKIIVLMGDGEPTTGCGGDEEDDAINSAKWAYEEKGIKVYTIGFMVNKEGREVLEKMANVGGGKYYDADEIYKLSEIYEQISDEIKTEYTATTPYLVRVVFYDSDKTYSYDIINPPLPLETKTYTIPLKDQIGDIQKVEIYSVGMSEKGEEVIIRMMDSFEF